MKSGLFANSSNIKSLIFAIEKNLHFYTKFLKLYITCSASTFYAAIRFITSYWSEWLVYLSHLCAQLWWFPNINHRCVAIMTWWSPRIAVQSQWITPYPTFTACCVQSTIIYNCGLCVIVIVQKVRYALVTWVTLATYTLHGDIPAKASQILIIRSIWGERLRTAAPRGSAAAAW